jgi:DNA (cytosine-5)-methyltransferase 1
VAYPASEGFQKRRQPGRKEGAEKTSAGLVYEFERRCEDLAYPNGQRGCGRPTRVENAADAWQPSGYSWDDARRMVSWHVEPDVGRVANGVPNRTHRLKALGNAIVPLWAFLVSKVAIAIYEHQPKDQPSE